MLFYLCETSNLFIVLSQIIVINKFLNYQFLSYGLQVTKLKKLIIKVLWMCRNLKLIFGILGIHLVLHATRRENDEKSESNVWSVSQNSKLWLHQAIDKTEIFLTDCQIIFVQFQIWSRRSPREEECTLYPGFEHDQWQDLPHHLVLVLSPCLHWTLQACLQDRHYCVLEI